MSARWAFALALAFVKAAIASKLCCECSSWTGLGGFVSDLVQFPQFRTQDSCKSCCSSGGYADGRSEFEHRCRFSGELEVVQGGCGSARKETRKAAEALGKELAEVADAFHNAALEAALATHYNYIDHINFEFDAVEDVAEVVMDSEEDTTPKLCCKCASVKWPGSPDLLQFSQFGPADTCRSCCRRAQLGSDPISYTDGNVATPHFCSNGKSYHATCNSAEGLVVV